MKPYLQLIERILNEGEQVTDRTGTGTLRVFGAMERYDISENKLPLITCRKLGYQFMIKEILWFLKGSGNCDYLDEQGVKIWKQWTDPESNSIGPLYPEQLRNWEGKDGKYDQIKALIKGLKEKPFSRRHVISYWNVPYLPDETISPIDNVKQGKMALAPCHVLLQFYVSQDKELSCMLTMRSSDVLVGRPANIAQYSILTKMIAQVCGYKAKEFIISSGDTHLYLNHLEEAKTLITREPYNTPLLLINSEVKDIDDFKLEDFTLVNYQAHPAMKLPIAI